MPERRQALYREGPDPSLIQLSSGLLARLDKRRAFLFGLHRGNGDLKGFLEGLGPGTPTAVVTAVIIRQLYPNPVS